MFFFLKYYISILFVLVTISFDLIETSILVMDKNKMRLIYFYVFKLDHKVGEAISNIN